MRIRKPTSSSRIQSQINITPLIDVLLVLLVIFMVITPTTPTGLDTEIPKESQPAAVTKPAPEALVLNIDQGRVITLNHNPVKSTGELTSELQNLFKTRSDRTIFIQGAKDLKFDDVVQVIDAARGGGANRIGLMTDPIH